VSEVFKRGYWKKEEQREEVELLDASEGGDITEKTRRVPCPKEHSGGEAVKTRRWTRIVRCAVGIAQAVNGFKWVEGTREAETGNQVVR